MRETYYKVQLSFRIVFYGDREPTLFTLAPHKLHELKQICEPETRAYEIVNEPVLDI